MDKIDEAIKKIEELAGKNIPVVVFPYPSPNREIALNIRYYNTVKILVLPEQKLELGFNKSETDELIKRLGVILRHFVLLEEKGECGRYYEFHWFSPTNIPGAVWHSVGWEYECVGTESDFIVVCMSLGESKDSSHIRL